MISRGTTSFARLFLIQLVLVNHCDSINGIRFKFTSPTLAFISGLLAVISFSSFRLKIKSVVKNLVFPFVLINIIYYIFYLVGKLIIISHGYGHLFYSPPPKLSLLGLFDGVILNPVNGPFWFLRNLIISHFVLISLISLPKNICILLTLISLILILHLKPGDRFYSPYCAGGLCGFFLKTDFGETVFKKLNNNISDLYKASIMVISGLLFVLFINQKWNQHEPFSAILSGPIFFCVLICGSRFIKTAGEQNIDRFSFFIFASHSAIIGGIKLLLNILHLDSVLLLPVLKYAFANIFCLFFFLSFSRKIFSIKVLR